MSNPLETQVGGSHYREMKIQPIEFKRECSTNKKIDLTILILCVILCVIGLILMTINSALMIIGML